MKKNKLIKLVKTGILLLGISMLFWNCENQNDESIIENQNISQLENLFNIELISEQLNLGEDNAYVDWNKPEIIELNKKEKGGIYQYNLKLHKDIFNKSDLFQPKITYRLVVTQINNNFDFKILRYEPFKTKIKSKIDETIFNEFSGMKSIFNDKGVLQDIITYENGQKIASFNETKNKRSGKHSNLIFSKADSSDFDECTDLNGNPIPGCKNSGGGGSGTGSGSTGGGYVLETTRNYTDWYNMCNICTNSDGTLYHHTDGNTYIYIKTKYNGSTTRWVWVSNGSDRYVDFYEPRTSSGSRGPNFTYGHRNYTGNDDDKTGDQLPCPIGFQNLGFGCEPINNNGPIWNNGDTIVENPDNPINDIIDYLKCFNSNLPAILTIYANEPNPGTGDTHNGNYVGHTFISISQGNNVSTFGFYPVSDHIYPYINNSSSSVLGDDGSGSEQFSASLSTTISGLQLNQILNMVKNRNSTYHLDTYNCTDFAIEVGNLGGLNLPNSDGTWPGGGGSNPGTLGLHIRSLSRGTNITGGNAPATNKGC